MAKRSIPARQKTRHKKEYKFIEMPREKFIRLCVIAGVIIVAIVLFFVLRSALDGHLPVKDGVVVTGGDNWIVANTGSTDSPRYFKLGEAENVEGYALAVDETLTGTNVNTPYYAYTPLAEGAPLTDATVIVGNGDYAQLAQSVHQNTPSYLSGAVMGELTEEEIDGKKVCYFPYTYSYAQPKEDGTQGDTVYYRSVNAYMQAGRGRSIVLHLNAEGATEEALPAQDAMIAALPELVKGITVEK